MSRYKYTMQIDAKKLGELIAVAIGRTPDAMGKSGLHTFSFTFNDTDITVAERQTAKDALPEWMRLLYGFSREVLPDGEV